LKDIKAGSPTKTEPEVNENGEIASKDNKEQNKEDENKENKEDENKEEENKKNENKEEENKENENKEENKEDENKEENREDENKEEEKIKTMDESVKKLEEGKNIKNPNEKDVENYVNTVKDTWDVMVSDVYLPPPPPSDIQFEDYFFLKEPGYLHLGRKQEIEESKLKFKATLWVSNEDSSVKDPEFLDGSKPMPLRPFPMKIEQLYPVLDILGFGSNSHISTLRDVLNASVSYFNIIFIKSILNLLKNNIMLILIHWVNNNINLFTFFIIIVINSFQKVSQFKLV